MNLFALALLLGIGVLVLLGIVAALALPEIGDIVRRVVRWSRRDRGALDELLVVVRQRNEEAARKLGGTLLVFEPVL
ncbi:MAG: hypothetical protein KDN19_05920 [Verrucomicrobiae bacterium]|nr:hypothetical protein [Verrucomicrobiae bacterium]